MGCSCVGRGTEARSICGASLRPLDLLDELDELFEEELDEEKPLELLDDSLE